MAFNKHKLYMQCRKIHKWLGLIIGIQVLFWILGGLVMSALPLDKVHGDHLHKGKAMPQAKLSDYRFPINLVLANHQLDPKLVKFYQVEGHPVYEIHADKQYLISGIDGQAFPLMEQTRVQNRAQALFTGEQAIAEMRLIENLPREAGNLKLPVWKVVFDDSIDTTFYMDAHTGQLLKVRSDLWRVFDFFWMLHIMDYEEREDFNNPLLITFAASALMFTLTGLILLFQVFRKRDFQFRKQRA